MTTHYCLGFFRRRVTGLASVLITLALPVCARAAIAGGPVYTNAIASKQNLDTEFYRAAQSYQEKLKVGRERYDQKQITRAKIIEAMSAGLQAREETIVIPTEAIRLNPDEGPVSWSVPALVIIALAAGFVGASAYYLNRARRRSTVQTRRREVKFEQMTSHSLPP